MKEFNLIFSYKDFNFIFYVKNVFLMSKYKEISYKEAGNPVTFQVYEYSRLALCSISCVLTNSEQHVIVLRLSSAQVNT
jgi:hypothetical protein